MQFLSRNSDLSSLTNCSFEVGPFGLVGTGLVGARVNTSKECNRTLTGKTAYISNLHHNLGAKRVFHVEHGRYHGELRELRGRLEHLGFDLLQRSGNSIERVDGLSDQRLGHDILEEHNHQAFGTLVNALSANH